MMYDTIIIGAGLSGLAAGIRLAYYDQSVCILERHTTIGGLNSFYRLRNRNHDVGLHAVTNYAEPGTKKGPLSKLLRQLRLGWDTFDLSPQFGSQVAFPNHSLDFNNDFELLRSEIAKVFPTQIDGFDRLVQHIRDFNELDLSQQAVSARKVVGEFISDSILVDMLFCPLMFYGSAKPDDMDFNQFVIMFQAIFFEGFGRPYKGVRLIMKKITRQFKSLGGTLKLRAGVQKIVSDNGTATGVILDDGTELSAKKVLSSAGLAETLRLCEESLPEPSVINNFENQPGDISFCELIYSLDKSPREMGHNKTIIFYNDIEKFHYAKPDEPCDLRSGIICSPNNFDYPDGKDLDEGMIRVTALADPDYWLNLPEEEYRAAKVEWESKIRAGSQGHLPNYDEHILDADMFTPHTIRRFTGHINGCVYGSPEKALPGTTPLENLFLCGTDQGFLGIVGSMLSGITMANNHLLR